MADPTKPAFEINPSIVPQKTVKANGCPKCGSNFTGRREGMIILNKCVNPACGLEFSGGPNVTHSDPTIPTPPVDPKDRPLVDHIKTRSDQSGWREVRRAPSPVQPFRTGAPIPNEDD